MFRYYYPKQLCYPYYSAAMKEILEAFDKPQNKAKMQEIEQEAHSDLVKLLQERLPFAAEIQKEVIKCHGFSDDGDQGNSVVASWEMGSGRNGKEKKRHFPLLPFSHLVHFHPYLLITRNDIH